MTFAHLAIALCRCMNIPARYCTGYLGDMGTPPPYGVPDFAAWMEVYLGGGWYIFDPRNNMPRIGRVLIARGRDAADVAMVTTFGPYTLESFQVWTDEIEESMTVNPSLNCEFKVLACLSLPYAMSRFIVIQSPSDSGQHRMMFRPRESHDLKLLRTSLSITPNPSRLRWLHDVFDNSIAIAEFDGFTTELRFESIVTLQHFDTALPEYPLEEYANTYPFRYSDEDLPNLARALTRHYPGDDVRHWANQFLDPSGTTGTMKLAALHDPRHQGTIPVHATQ